VLALFCCMQWREYLRLCVAQLWVAPEVLRVTEGHTGHIALYGSRPADVYSFGVIMQEIATSNEPYYAFDLDLEGER